MANVVINELYLVNIADAIREKNGSEDAYKPRAMADAIRDIPQEGGSETIVEDIFGVQITDINALDNGVFDLYDANTDTILGYDLYYDDDGKVNEVYIPDFDISIEPIYNDDGTLIELYCEQTDEAIAVNDFDLLTFDEGGSDTPATNGLDDWIFYGSGLKSNTENKFKYKTFTAPEGATKLICDVNISKTNNTNSECIIYVSFIAQINNVGYIPVENLGNSANATSRTNVEIDLTKYVSGTDDDYTGNYSFLVRNERSAPEDSIETFGFTLEITNIRFE